MTDAEPKSQRDARAALLCAAAYSGTHANGAMVPEALLLAVLYDPGITQTNGALAEETRLRGAILESTETRDDQGWAPRAREAYRRAWKRAFARERERPLAERLGERLRLVSREGGKLPALLMQQGKLSVGDLLVGLEGSGPIVDAVLRERALDPRRFDEESPLPGVGPLDGVADDAPVDVVMMNDDTTPMNFVVQALEEHFGCSQMQALALMYRVHVCGRARVARLPRVEAERRVHAVTNAARAANRPLVVVHGPRAII